MSLPIPSPITRLGETLSRRLYKTLDKRTERRAWPQWFLLVGDQGAERVRSPDPGKLNPIYPPPDRFWADPFLWTRDGRHWLFCEEYLRETHRGRISVLELDADIKATGRVLPVLDEPRHLSYPFLFEHRGELYMVPESARTRRVDLYRCDNFPDRWTLVATLLRDIEAADATLFEHAGRWWLFCSARIGRTRPNDSLYAFHADSPTSEHWTPHPANPLVRGFAGSRPAGRIVRDQAGALLRPAQLCVPRYGYGLRLNEIETLTTERYVEREIWSMTGRAAGGWHAMHHLDRHQGLITMDAQRLIPR